MKAFLLSVLAIGCAASMYAQPNLSAKTQRVNNEALSQVTTAKLSADVKVLSSKSLAKDVKLQVVQTQSGITTKRIITNRAQAINPMAAKKVKPQDAASGISLSEGFEGSNGSASWQPAGWTIESKGEPFESEYIEVWCVSTASAYNPSANGTYYEGINFSTKYKDEWLITPEVTLTDYPNLYYYAYVSPVFLFNLNNVDWDALEFTKKEVAANLEVLVKASDETEWTKVKDYYDEYKDYSLSELLEISNEELEKFSIDLKKWAGKKVKVAFRYVGTDGNTMFVDDVMLSNPAIEARYSYPLGSLYYGMTKDFNVLSLSMPTLPVYQELTWTNTTEETGIATQWKYQDWATNEVLTTNTFDLTQTYKPDYSSEFTCRNNCYNSPILTVSKEGAAPGDYSIYSYFQAGGRAEWKIDGEISVFGLLPFDINTEGLNIATADADMDEATPVFGYNKNVDKFWTDYTFQGQEEEGEGVKLTAILNYYFTQEKPIVYDEAWVAAKGLIGENANFKLEIIPLDDEGMMEAPIASANCKGSDMVMTEGGTKNFYNIPFKFAAPIVMSQDVCAMYVIRLSGFNDSTNVSYFAPYQSTIDNPDGYALGWIEKEITMGGETRTSLSPTAYYTGFHSFAIAIDGAYPWLEAETNEIMLPSSGTADVALGSYYDGSKLTATQADGSPLPAWLSVELSGCYGEAKATFTGKSKDATSCDVLISAPGVKQVINVATEGYTAITDINADSDAQTVGIYNMCGQRVSGDLPAGIYIIRQANGKTQKVIK